MVKSKTFLVWFGAALLIAAAFCGAPLSAQVIPQPIAPASYRIRIGDAFEVSVYQHPELFRRVVVMGDGNYALKISSVKVSHLSAMDGIVHDLNVVGLSVMDVAALLRGKLKSIIPQPQVTVI